MFGKSLPEEKAKQFAKRYPHCSNFRNLKFRHDKRNAIIMAGRCHVGEIEAEDFAEFNWWDGEKWNLKKDGTSFLAQLFLSPTSSNDELRHIELSFDEAVEWCVWRYAAWLAELGLVKEEI